MLNHQQIKKLILKKGLIQNYINLEKQLTPNGFDLTVEEILEFDSLGSLDFSNKERRIPQGSPLLPKKQSPEDKFGWWHLKKGVYKIRTNEIIKLDASLVALCFPRTSLLRMGAFSQHGIWDAGFEGKGEFILVVENPFGIMLKQNARIVQLIFFKIKKAKSLYNGLYKQKKG
ncbi:MAG: deoxyuridine 5'-triphosphate nucleotidohydrolase [Candidatus Omnitrophica bacterium]|nr:deoxyuridine 5'-triphosphate nucleotidohydrolase [Candidatus Omnitrophota bacterium]